MGGYGESGGMCNQKATTMGRTQKVATVKEGSYENLRVVLVKGPEGGCRGRTRLRQEQRNWKWRVVTKGTTQRLVTVEGEGYGESRGMQRTH